MSEGSGGIFDKLFGGKKRKEAAGRKALETELAVTQQRLTDLDKQAAVPGWSHRNDIKLAEQLTARQNEIRKQLGIPEQETAAPAMPITIESPQPQVASPRPVLKPLSPQK